MCMAFFFEPWLPLGDSRWFVLGMVAVVCYFLIELLPDELEWVARVKDSSAWKLLRLRVAVQLHAKHSTERAEDEYSLGWKAGGLGDAKLNKRFWRRIAKYMGLGTHR